MVLDDLPSLAGFAAAIRRPDTLAERGVAAPFVTPVLVGARLRATGRGGGGVEVLLPHPAGREGCFVVPWSAALQECRPLHADRLMVAALGDGPVGPRQVWLAARGVAETGLHGRAAAAAALAARAAEEAWRDTLSRALAARQRGAEALAPALLACGTADAPGGSATVEQRRVEDLARALARWAEDDAPTGEDRQRARELAAAAAAAARSAARLIAAARALAGEDVRALLSPERAREAMRAGERPGWALNGFALLAALWAEAPAPDRPAALRAGARLAPPPADEMLAWPGVAPWTAPAPTQAPRLSPTLTEGALAALLRP